MRIIAICLLMEKKSLSLKLIMETSTFQLNFAYEAYLESEEVSFKGNVDYDAIHKSDILDIYKYLMIMNNMK